MQALPQAAFFLLLEAAVGGTIALFWVHLRGEVPRGFTLFTGACLLVCGALAIWLRSAFPAAVGSDVDAAARMWLQAERILAIAFVLLLAVYLLALRSKRAQRISSILGPLVPLVGLASVWGASLAAANGQLFGFGEPLAVLAGTVALGSALTGLSLGHWYLVSPTLSIRPLIGLTFMCLGAVVVQLVLLPVLLATAGSAALSVPTASCAVGTAVVAPPADPGHGFGLLLRRLAGPSGLLADTPFGGHEVVAPGQSGVMRAAMSAA